MTGDKLLFRLVAADIDNPFKDVKIDFSWLTGKNAAAFAIGIGLIWGVLLIWAAIKLMPAIFHIRDAIKKNMSHEVEHARKELLGSALVFIVMGCFMVLVSLGFIIINLVSNAAG
ncbi:hypothetical protein ACIPY5_19885 [Microbacterium sp. NPDC089698]|uniref:hypothetical protein n=1 Tax=Microbacterium sp. NPDC089698 TaxID=3364200 RepID=UPI003817EEF3